MKRLILSIAIGLAMTTSANASAEASKAELTQTKIAHSQKMADAVAADCASYEGMHRGVKQGIRKRADGTCEFYSEEKIGDLEGDYSCPLNKELMILAEKHYKNKVLFFKGKAEYNNDFGDAMKCAFIADVDKEAQANSKEINEKKLADKTAKESAESAKLSASHNEEFNVIKEKELADLKIQKALVAKAKKRDEVLKKAEAEAEKKALSESGKNKKEATEK